MLKFSALIAFIGLGFMVWCLVDAISTDGRRIRNLPKVAWVLLILFLPLVGSIAWLLGGRPSAAAELAGATPGPDLATRADSRNPAEEAADFSTRIRERAEEQRRRYEQQKKKDADKDKPEAGTEQP